MKNKSKSLKKIIISVLAILLLLTILVNLKYYVGTPKLIAGRKFAIDYTELILMS